MGKKKAQSNSDLRGESRQVYRVDGVRDLGKCCWCGTTRVQAQLKEAPSATMFEGRKLYGEVTGICKDEGWCGRHRPGLVPEPVTPVVEVKATVAAPESVPEVLTFGQRIAKALREGGIYPMGRGQ